MAGIVDVGMDLSLLQCWPELSALHFLSFFNNKRIYNIYLILSYY
jgi:hypothetical protein